MKPYLHKRLTEAPDVADIRSEGRASRVGKLDGHQYCQPTSKAKARRTLKRRDRAAAQRQLREDESGN